MATAFDGLGMGMLGKERQHMSGGPFSELGKMIPAGLAAYGLVKSGAVKNLNEGLNPKKMITDWFDSQTASRSRSPADVGYNAAQDTGLVREAVVPPDAATSMSPAIPPGMSNSVELSPAPVPQTLPPINVDQHIENAFPLRSSVSPDTFKRDVSQDMAALQTTQAQAPPPSNVGQGQMNKAPKSDGGANMASIIKLLMAFA
jgi:hypothetical protein